MPEVAVILSTREAERVEEYARQNGITPEEVIKTMYDKNLDRRLRFSRTEAEIKTFPSLKKN